MKEIFVLDWILNKPIRLLVNDHVSISIGDKIEYFYTLGNKQKKSVGIYLGYKCESIKSGTFISVLDKNKLYIFEKLKYDAEKYFQLFKKVIKQVYDNVFPVMARIAWNQEDIYFYFYSEKKLDFSLFNKAFKYKLPYFYFLYQLGARDAIRYSKEFDNVCGSCGNKKLCCKLSNCPLPTITTEELKANGIDIVDSYRIKGICGKIKCCYKYSL